MKSDDIPHLLFCYINYFHFGFIYFFFVLLCFVSLEFFNIFSHYPVDPIFHDDMLEYVIVWDTWWTLLNVKITSFHLLKFSHIICLVI